MSVDVKYAVEARASGNGRDGRTMLKDGTMDLRLTMPRELGGPGGDGANPEKLFAMGYAACYLSALRVAAQQQKLRLPDEASVDVRIGIGPRSEGGFGITAALAVHLPGVDPAEAWRLVEVTHGICPYSNALRGNVDLPTEVRT